MMKLSMKDNLIRVEFIVRQKGTIERRYECVKGRHKHLESAVFHKPQIG